MEPPPPTYEAAMLGQPLVIAPMMPHHFHDTSLQRYVHGSTAPSAPELSPPPPGILDHFRFWHHYGLDLMTGSHQLCLSGRRGDKYTITDTTKSLLYSATIDTETTCFCCSAPRGPGITFNLASRNDQHVLQVHRSLRTFCCTAEETEVTVHLPPDVMLGTIEGKGQQFTIINPSGDVTCYVEKEEDGCCSCANISYRVMPAGFPHDLGTVTLSSEGLVISFPSILDVATRTLVLCCALNLQYTKEEEKKAAG